MIVLSLEFRVYSIHEPPVREEGGHVQGWISLTGVRYFVNLRC